MKHFYLLLIFLISTIAAAQSDDEQILNTLNNYMEGTSYNRTEQIQKAFIKEANLYLDSKDDGLRIVPITEYISWFKKGTPGDFNGRIGNVLSVEKFGNIASAKLEILIPSIEKQFIDMILLKKIKNEWKIISKTANGIKNPKKGNKILFIVSNAHFYGDSKLKTGNSFSEIVNAYDTFISKGYTIDFVSPKGGAIPLAYMDTADPLQKKYIYNADFMYALEHTKTVAQLNPADYKAVHYIGGGSAMFEVPVNTEIQDFVMKNYEDYNGIISSVCHGTAGISYLKTKDGRYLVDGKTVNGYPDDYENMKADYFKHFPFKIKKTIEEHGGTFKFSPRNTPHVEVDGRLVTGQNYLSSKPVALKIVELLQLNLKSNP